MNLVPVEYNADVLAKLVAVFPELAEMNTAAISGINAGHPMIALNGTRFIVKENGEEKTLPTLELNVAIVAAKESLSKAYYATKFTPGQEPQSPDCMSSNGVTPDASSKLKQADNCAGCKWNQFGTSTAADGTPGKGKACTDGKMIVLYINGGPYLFKIPPASLNNFGAYVKSLTNRGIPMACCVTTIGFDPAHSFPVLTFNFAGMLAPDQIKTIMSVASSPTVLDMVGKKVPLITPAPAVPPVQVTQTVVAPVVEPVITPVVEPVVVEAPVEKIVAETPKPVVDSTPVSASDAELMAALGL